MRTTTIPTKVLNRGSIVKDLQFENKQEVNYVDFAIRGSFSRNTSMIGGKRGIDYTV